MYHQVDHLLGNHMLEIGQIGQIEQIGQIGKIGQIGQIGWIGQIGRIGQLLNRVGHRSTPISSLD